MTDERMGNGLWAALATIPRGSGVILRHYATDRSARRALSGRITRVARRRGLVVVRAGAPLRVLDEDGVHGSGTLSRPPRHRPGALVTWPAHSRIEAMAAMRAGAGLLFVSPVFPTRSHPGARPLGPIRAAAIGRGLGLPVIALGGMNERRFRRLKRLGFHGWAAIDAWLGDQKRNAVPR